MLKSSKNSKILKNDAHFRILYLQISLKQYLNICENVVYFFYYLGGRKMMKDFCKTIKKIFLNGQFRFFYIMQLPHTVISNSEKLTHPGVTLTKILGF